MFLAKLSAASSPLSPFFISHLIQNLSLLQSTSSLASNVILGDIGKGTQPDWLDSYPAKGHEQGKQLQ